MTALLPVDLAVFLPLFGRTAGFLFAAPVLGDRALPARIKVALAVLLAGALSGLHEPDADGLGFVLPLEIAFGLACGFAARLVIAGLEIAGELIGIHMGMGFAAAYDPALGESALVMRRIAHTLGALAFVLAGGVEATARLVALPPVAATTLGTVIVGAILRSGETLTTGLRLATPIIVAVLTANLAMGLASRAAPALNVFSVMLAVTAAMGGLILVATAPEFARTIEDIGARAVEFATGRIFA